MLSAPNIKRRDPIWASPVLQSVVLHLVLTLGAITMVVPFLWMLSSSLQARAQIYKMPPEWIPHPVRWQNYREVWTAIDMARYFANSTFVSTVVTTLTVLLSAMAGYAFAKYHFRGKNIAFVYILCTLMIPYQVTLIPLFLIFRKLGLLDTYLALILPGLTSAFGIFMMRQFIAGIPDDLLDSARIDGAGETRMFFQILLPNVKPAASALAIFVFVGIWNDFLWPLVAINRDELKPLQLGLASFVQQYSASWHLVMAGATCALLPVLIVFLIFQRQFVAGIVLSGMRE